MTRSGRRPGAAAPAGHGPSPRKRRRKAAAGFLVGGLPGREVAGQVAPLGGGADQPAEGVERSGERPGSQAGRGSPRGPNLATLAGGTTASTVGVNHLGGRIRPGRIRPRRSLVRYVTLRRGIPFRCGRLADNMPSRTVRNCRNVGNVTMTYLSTTTARFPRFGVRVAL